MHSVMCMNIDQFVHAHRVFSEILMNIVRHHHQFIHQRRKLAILSDVVPMLIVSVVKEVWHVFVRRDTLAILLLVVALNVFLIRTVVWISHVLILVVLTLVLEFVDSMQIVGLLIMLRCVFVKKVMPVMLLQPVIHSTYHQPIRRHQLIHVNHHLADQTVVALAHQKAMQLVLVCQDTEVPHQFAKLNASSVQSVLSTRLASIKNVQTHVQEHVELELVVKF